MNELLFTGFQLYDGTGRAPFAADVAVREDKIAEVAPAGTIKRTGAVVVEGKGLSLTPGFVDVHTHSDGKVVQVPTADSKISQGVTTGISGNCGFSDYLDAVKDNDLGEHILKVRGNFDAYATLVENTHPAVNMVHMCGHNTLRAFVMGYENRHATKEELRRMKELLAEALEHGAGGFSGGPYYLPGKFAPTEELKELAALLKGTGKPYATHMRSEGDGLFEGIEEAIEIAKAGDCNLEISHLKASPRRNWSKIDHAFELIESAQKSGLKVLADRYPYTYCSTSLLTIMPPPFNVISSTELCGKLKASAETRAALLEAFRLHPYPTWDRVILVNSLEPSHRQYYGKTMTEIAAAMGCTPDEAAVNLLASGRCPSAAFGSMCEENLHKILAKPWVMAGSDGNIRRFDDTSTHPRAFGTHPRFFRIAVKYNPPEQVIRRMTALPAAKFNLTGRGIVAPGYFADLALLDLDKYDSFADYAHPNVRAEGVRAVYVNGGLAYSPDPEVKTFRPGRMLRIPQTRKY